MQSPMNSDDDQRALMANDDMLQGDMGPKRAERLNEAIEMIREGCSAVKHLYQEELSVHVKVSGLLEEISKVNEKSHGGVGAQVEEEPKLKNNKVSGPSTASSGGLASFAKTE